MKSIKNTLGLFITMTCLILGSTNLFAGDITLTTLDSYGNPIAGDVRVQLGPNYIGTFPSGSVVTLNDGLTYKIWATYLSTSTARLNYTVNGNDALNFSTTEVTIHFSGGYCNYRGSGSWKSFTRPTMQLFPKDFYGNTMEFQFGDKWNNTRYMYKTIDYEGQTSIEKTIAVLQLLAHDGSPISGATARGGNGAAFGTWHVPGTTDAKGLLMDCRNGNPAALSYEMKYNLGTQVVGPQNPSTHSYYNFQTELVTLRLETCGGSPLDGGHPRYGTGASFGTAHWPNGNTGQTAPGETNSQMFQGTYSFDMQYQGTSDQKISVNIPDGGATFTWQTTNVQLNYSGAISYGGSSGDSRHFIKPSMELLAGTYKFHFRPGNRTDITISGCSTAKTAAIIDVNDCSGGHQSGIDFFRYKWGSKGSTYTQIAAGAATPYLDLMDGNINHSMAYVVEYLNGSNQLVQNPSTNSDYEFNMTTARVELRDVCGDIIDFDGSLSAYSWGSANSPFSITMTDGVAEMCLLPGNYAFVCTYNGGNVNSGSHNIASTHVFQTGQVADNGYGATQYYRHGNAGNPMAFVDGMQLLPGKYGFKNPSTLLTDVVAAMVLDLNSNTTSAPSCPLPKSAIAFGFGENNLEITMYPNPTNSSITIEAEGTVNIFSVSGKLMYSGESTTINVSEWAKGVYFVKANGATGKLVVQ